MSSRGHCLTSEDGQLKLLTAISAFGDWVPPMFISTNNNVEDKALADQQ
jgi:hypothetical protein